MTKGESAFGFKAYGGGQGLQKWDKGMQTILEANAHPAALAIYEGDLKSPTTVEEAKVSAKNIWENLRTTTELMKQGNRKKSFKKLDNQQQLIGGFAKELFKILVNETVEESIARQMVLKGAAKGAGEIKAKFYDLWGTIEDTQRTQYEAALRSGCFKAEGMRAAEDEDMISWLAVYEALISKIKDTYESEKEAEAAPMINYPEDVRGLIASLPSGYAPAMQALKKTQATEKQLVVYQMEIQMAMAMEASVMLWAKPQATSRASGPSV